MSYRDLNDRLARARILKKEWRRQRDEIKKGNKNPYPNFIHNLPENIKGLGKNITSDINNP